MSLRRAAAAALCLWPSALFAHDADVTRAARDFLALLRPELRTECVQPFEGDERTSWSYLPGRRKGVPLKRMNPAERAAARAMLGAGLSARGYEKTEGVLLLEGILREIETFGFGRDPDLYYVTVFGSPSDERPWSWRFEGHHLSLHFSSASGRVVSETPAFFGANPARVPSGPHAGLRVLGAEEDLARRLLASFDSRQRGVAVIAAAAPSDIVLGPGRKTVPDPEGLSAAEMTAAQKKALMDLVGEYLGNMRAGLASKQREKIEKAGIEKVRFAWAGGSSPGQGHYYRVQGPTFVIEYDNTQNGANHVHSVYRDLEDDFGGDLLRRHYAQDHRVIPSVARSSTTAPATEGIPPAVGERRPEVGGNADPRQ
jgi:Protein of unknown function (DUF3500)